ncbi:MAG: APC family permease [Treponema sp.]|nr:APC family permease [Treponema sp.]
MFGYKVWLGEALLSVCAYPPEYASWFDYLRDMGNLKGVKAVPAFYAAYHYLGKTGIFILMLSLFGVILTSLIGNLLALSRILYAAGKEGDAPYKLTSLNKRAIPYKAIFGVVAVSLFIPFLGRTAIGWIVDVTTLGSTMIYGMLSYAVFRHGCRTNCAQAKYGGLIGTVLMLCFLLLLLIPGLLPFHAMETESYAFFIVWAILGLVYFCIHIKREHHYGQGLRVVVWILLLMLVLFASMMWAARTTENAAHTAIEQIFEYHETHEADDSDEDVRAERIYFLESQAKFISRTNILYTVVSLGLFILSAGIILYSHKDARKLGRRLYAAEEAERAARKIAELKRSITSLIDNMPGLNYSKDAETGAYLACNQRFAEYVKKESPKQVFGLTDKDLFDEQLSAQFANDDNIALSMDDPYIFYEDLLDSQGNSRQFQTTKMKYVMQKDESASSVCRRI